MLGGDVFPRFVVRCAGTSRKIGSGKRECSWRLPESQPCRKLISRFQYSTCCMFHVFPIVFRASCGFHNNMKLRNVAAPVMYNHPARRWRWKYSAVKFASLPHTPNTNGAQDFGQTFYSQSKDQNNYGHVSISPFSACYWVFCHGISIPYLK